MARSSAPPFQLMASKTATVKRPPAMSAGKRGAPVLVADLELKVLPLMPVDPQVRLSIPLDTPNKLYHTFTEGSDPIDLEEGDILVIDSVEYDIKSISEWPYDEWVYYEVIVEAPEL